MKVCVDQTKCQGHARCVQAAPQIFEQDEQGYSYTSDDDVPVELQDAVRLAEQNCPEGAVVITD